MTGLREHPEIVIHTYNEKTADEIAEVVKKAYYNEFVKLHKKLESLKEKVRE